MVYIYYIIFDAAYKYKEEILERDLKFPYAT